MKEKTHNLNHIWFKPWFNILPQYTMFRVLGIYNFETRMEFCPKKQGFWPKVNILKGNHFIFVNTMKSKSWLIYVKNQWFFFFLFKLLKEYQFRRPFFVINIFSDFNFWTNLFSKSFPNFSWTNAHSQNKMVSSTLRMLILCPKPCFLGTTVFEIQQPNGLFKGAFPLYLFPFNFHFIYIRKLESFHSQFQIFWYRVLLKTWTFFCF